MSKLKNRKEFEGDKKLEEFNKFRKIRQEFRLGRGQFFWLARIYAPEVLKVKIAGIGNLANKIYSNLTAYGAVFSQRTYFSSGIRVIAGGLKYFFLI